MHKWGSSSGVRWDYVKDEVREEASLNRATIYNYALKSKRVNMDLLIRYNTTLWKYHDLALLAGYSGSLYDSDSFDATKEGMSSWYLIYMNSATKMNSINGSATNWRMQSYFGRLNICSKRMFVMMVLPVFLLIHVGEHFLLSLLDGVSRKNILWPEQKIICQI